MKKTVIGGGPTEAKGPKAASLTRGSGVRASLHRVGPVHTHVTPQQHEGHKGASRTGRK